MTKVDWLSFTFPVGREKHPENGWRFEDIQDAFRTYTGDGVSSLFSDSEVTHDKGRAPYAHRASMHSGIFALYWSGRLNHALLECHGQGMAYAREKDMEKALLLVASERVTRVDVATDIETKTTPSKFVDKRTRKSQRSRGSFTSSTGETEYVGGRKSNRFARVYRYRPPHPRSHLLRVEHEIKGTLAKQVLPEIVSMGVETVQERLALSFGWSHPDWQPMHQNLNKIKEIPNDRTLAKTELWLRTQAASAFKKLVAQGIIQDPEMWLREVFLDEIHPNHRTTLQ